MLKCAVVGNGYWAENYLKEGKIVGLFELKKFAVPFIDRNNKGFGACDIVLTALKSWAPSLVIFATIPKVQHRIALELLENDIALILEKPFGVEDQEIRSLYQGVQYSNSPVLTNHFQFFDKQFTEFLNSPRRNPLTSIKILDGNNGPFRKRIDPLFDWGCHSLSLGLAFFGPGISRVEAKLVPGFSEDGEIFNIKCAFEHGGFLDSTFGNGFRKRDRNIEFFSGNNLVADYRNGVLSHDIFNDRDVVLRSSIEASPMQQLLINMRELIFAQNGTIHPSTHAGFKASLTLAAVRANIKKRSSVSFNGLTFDSDIG